MKITYEIQGSQGAWSLRRNGEAGANYVTAEGAFEAAAMQASIEMRYDHEIHIFVRPQHQEAKERET